MAALELRPGARVRYEPVHSGEWRDGTLVRRSPNGEEWLVSNRFGRVWVKVGRLFPPDQ
jgi:hypothetical protein